MPWLRVLFTQLGDLLGRARSERELDSEIDTHVAMLTEEHVRAGMPRDAAYRAARLKLGGLDQTKEAFRDTRRLPLAETVWQDVRYAVRALARTPAFTLAALVTLGLGIGGTTAIFSVVNAVLFKPLPYPEPDRILVLVRDQFSTGMTGRVFHYVRDRVQSFERVAAQGGAPGWNLVVGNEAEHVQSSRVTDGFFELLGIRPLAGREFTRVESQPEGPRVVILSEALWRRRFGGQPDAIGRVIELGGIPHTVVGVAPSQPRTVSAPDVWTPLQVSPTDDGSNYTVLGRLRPGVSYGQAHGEFETLRTAMIRELSGADARVGSPLAWMTYQNHLAQGQRTALLTLLGAVGFLLLIACANVASLQLVRATARRREMATRSALGGGAGRLAQQVLTESVLLGLGGGLLGVLMARWGVGSVLALAPEGITFGQPVGLDWRVLLVAMTLAVGTGLLFGIAPALDPGRLVLRTALWDTGTRHTAGRHTAWLRRLFVVTEVALAVVLLVGAGLLFRTFVSLRSVPLGFDPQHVITAEMSLHGSRRQASDEAASFFQRTLERIHELPGVEVAAVGNNVPVQRGLNLALAPPAGGIVTEPRAVDWRYVTPEYFTLFRIALRDGRFFDERDTSSGTPVAIVNQTFARSYFGRGSAVGRHIQLRVGTADDPLDPLREIVGVVADVKSGSGSGWTSGRNSLAAAAPPIMYVPIGQVPETLAADVHGVFPVNWAVRTRGASGDLVSEIQDIVRAAEPSLPFIRFRTMEELIGIELETERFHMTLVGIFAGIAILVAAIGLYGLVAYSVSQRTQEIGVRLALGATALSVLGHVLREGLVLALIGVAFGLVGATMVSQALQSFIWGVEPLDPLTYAAVAALLVCIAALASFAPALRAARINPTQALRWE
ncbi:MAG: FtsX-like permease family protein [Luteitalea sp.]|nr:FtsX-like permease family protein [Luteitalea sp.]